MFLILHMITKLTLIKSRNIPEIYPKYNIPEPKTNIWFIQRCLGRQKTNYKVFFYGGWAIGPPPSPKITFRKVKEQSENNVYLISPLKRPHLGHMEDNTTEQILHKSICYNRLNASRLGEKAFLSDSMTHCGCIVVCAVALPSWQKNNVSLPIATNSRKDRSDKPCFYEANPPIQLKIMSHSLLWMFITSLPLSVSV